MKIKMDENLRNFTAFFILSIYLLFWAYYDFTTLNYLKYKTLFSLKLIVAIVSLFLSIQVVYKYHKKKMNSNIKL